MNLEGILKNRRNEILQITARHGARNVRVFGSFAKGTTVESSDFDILVEMEEGRSLFDIIAIKQDLEDLLELDVDVVTETSLSPYIRKEVLKEAVGL